MYKKGPWHQPDFSLIYLLKQLILWILIDDIRLRDTHTAGRQLTTHLLGQNQSQKGFLRSLCRDKKEIGRYTETEGCQRSGVTETITVILCVATLRYALISLLFNLLLSSASPCLSALQAPYVFLVCYASCLLTCIISSSRVSSCLSFPSKGQLFPLLPLRLTHPCISRQAVIP